MAILRTYIPLLYSFKPLHWKAPRVLRDGKLTCNCKCVTQTSTHSAVTSPSTSSGLTRPLPRTQEPFVLAKSLLRIKACSNTGSVECSMKGKCLKMFHVGQCGNLPPPKKGEMFVRLLQAKHVVFFHLPNQISPASYAYPTHR